MSKLEHPPLLSEEQVAWLGNLGTAEQQFWEDVVLLGRRVLDARDDSLPLAWHHFLLAAGNFKRQGGTKIFPPSIRNSLSLPSDEHATEEVLLPNGERISKDDPQTWAALTNIPGIAEATATTVLSALWPESHFIVDQRALTAALAIVGVREGWDQIDLDPKTSEDPEVTFPRYKWYRKRILSTAKAHEVSGVLVERSLYWADKGVESAKNRSWEAYAQELFDYLDDKRAK